MGGQVFWCLSSTGARRRAALECDEVQPTAVRYNEFAVQDEQSAHSGSCLGDIQVRRSEVDAPPGLEQDLSGTREEDGAASVRTK